MNIRVMSSNIWGNCPANRPIANRGENLRRVFMRYIPDFIGMQEHSPKYCAETSDMAKMIAERYEAVPVEPTNELKNNFTPLYYNKERFDLIEGSYLLYNSLNDAGSKSITWGVFEEKASKDRVIIVNTHYYWTSDPEGEQARIQNTGELLNLYAGLKAKYGVPAFFTGDFNCTSDSIPAKGLLDGGLKETCFMAEEPVVPTRSYHEYPDINDADPGHIFYENGHMPNDHMEESIDHIFCDGDVTIRRYVTVVDREALEASDHCPIYADAVC